jgi:hypothetical protein
MNSNPKVMLKTIEDQQQDIRELKQEVLTLSKRFSRTRITQTLLLSILMKYDPKLLNFFENEVQKLEQTTSFDQASTGEIIQLKKVLNDIRKLRSSQKKCLSKTR